MRTIRWKSSINSGGKKVLHGTKEVSDKGGIQPKVRREKGDE